MPQQKLEDMTMMEKVTWLRRISLFPAITVMVFMRRRIGYRMVNPTWLIILAVVMVGVPLLYGALARPFGFLMVVYAIAMVILGVRQRLMRWKELCGHTHWYTYCPGISYFESMNLPAFLTSHYRINRFLDPLAVGIVGVIIALALSHVLGMWILFSAFFLYVFEQDLYERSVNRDLDTLDGMFMSKVQSDLVKAFDGKNPEEEKQRSMDETAGIPTGLAPDLHVRVRIMQIEFGGQKPAGPDNLAPESTDIQV